MNISHEYSKPGTYTIITENIETFAQGTVVDSAISSPIVKFRALNKSQTNGSHLFDGWNNLLKIYKLTNTFNSYDYMFNNCSKLVDVDLSGCTLSQTVTTMAYMCNGCSKFTKTPIKVIPDTCTNISYIFANSGIVDISGLTFGSRINNITSWISPKLTTANNLTVKCPQLLFKGNKTLVSIDNFTVSSNIRNISSWFEGCVKLSNDFNISSHITNCNNTFKGCSSMTHVHSNWDNTYTNGITSTDCYAGCNGITHIDDENVISYEGDLGVDYIPLDWGGNGFTLDCTMIYELDITDEFLNTPLKPIVVKSLLALNESVAKVNWGDGSPAELLCVNGGLTEHNYTTKGTYFVKAHVSMGHGYGVGFKGAISKILQVPKYEYGRINSILSYACSGASNMTYADFSNLAYEKGVTKFNVGAMFMNCNKLKTVIIPSDWIIENCGSMFRSCYSLESVDFIKSWDISNVKDMSNMFSGCESLLSVDFLINWNINNVKSIKGMFNGCKKITEVNFNPDTYMANYSGSLSRTFYECSELTRITGLKLNPENLYNTQNAMDGFIGRAHKIRYIENMYLGGSNANAYNIFSYSDRGVIPESSVTFVWDSNSIFKGFNTSIDPSISMGYESLLRVCTPESRQSFAENVYDRVSNGLDTITVNNLGSAYLNEEQIALITSKGYTLVN